MTSSASDLRDPVFDESEVGSATDGSQLDVESSGVVRNQLRMHAFKHVVQQCWLVRVRYVSNLAKTRAGS